MDKAGWLRTFSLTVSAYQTYMQAVKQSVGTFSAQEVRSIIADAYVFTYTY